MKSVAVKAPGFGVRREAMLADMAILTGGEVISEKVGLKLRNADLALLGRARNIVIKDETTIVDGAGDSLQLHFLRNVLAQVSKASAEMVAAAICTILLNPRPTWSAISSG